MMGGDGCITLPDMNVHNDGGTTGEVGPGHDMGGGDTGVSQCGHAGLAGGPCRAGMCQASLRCWDPAMLPANASTIQGLFNLQQGDLTDPMHPGYQIVQMPQNPMDSAPFNGWEGTFCAQECDTTATTDTCGACNSCSRTLTQMPLVAAFGGVGAWYGNMGMFPYANEGVCRLQCTYDHTTRGNECDPQHTCDAFGGVCVEACTSDNECNTAFGVTYAGQTVTLLDTMNPQHCNMTTGRCESAGTMGAAVGTMCTTGNNCAPGVGVCLNGGHCAEFNGCTNGQPCGPSNNGVCLAVNNTMHAQSLCLLGCSTSTDCGPGNTCQQFMMGMIGGHTGYCLGVCASDDQCIATETCTDYTTTDPMTGMATAHNGQCVHRCAGTGAPIMVGQIGMSTGMTPAAGDCLTTEFCVADHMGANYGRCVPLNGLCGTPNTNSLPAVQADCSTGQLCDETLATPHDAPTMMAPRGPLQAENFGDGHCVAPCTATSCTAPAVCVPVDAACPAHTDMMSCGADTMHHCSWSTAGAGSCNSTLGGLCRQPCTMDAVGTCPTDQHCDTTLGYCVECPTVLPTGTTAPANCM
jgi:hypothetical protein